jgi:hypothetical protein
MIVVDTDVTSYFWLQMTVDRSAAARAARERGADRVVPYLWRSEFRSVLRGYMTRDLMTLAEAKRFHNQALDDLRGHEYEIPAAPVLELVAETGPSPDGRRDASTSPSPSTWTFGSSRATRRSWIGFPTRPFCWKSLRDRRTRRWTRKGVEAVITQSNRGGTIDRNRSVRIRPWENGTGSSSRRALAVGMLECGISADVM